jgi:hypothetical protein
VVNSKSNDAVLTIIDLAGAEREKRTGNQVHSFFSFHFDTTKLGFEHCGALNFGIYYNIIIVMVSLKCYLIYLFCPL